MKIKIMFAAMVLAWIVSTLTVTPSLLQAARPRLDVHLRYAGIWPGYSNNDRVRLDRSALLRMPLGATQALYVVVAGSSRLSNVYLDLYAPLDQIAAMPSAIWPAADLDGVLPSGAGSPRYARFTAYFPVINPDYGLTPSAPLRFEARAAGAAQWFWRVSTAELRPIEGRFTVRIEQP